VAEVTAVHPVVVLVVAGSVAMKRPVIRSAKAELWAVL